MVRNGWFSGTKNSLKKIFGTVNSVSREAMFEFEKNMITVKCHDTSKTVYLEMKTNKNYFDEFKIEKKVEIGFNVLRVLKIIEMCTGKISVLINEDVSVVSKDLITIEARIPQIYIEEEEVIVPQYNYTTSATLKVEHFNNILSHTLEFSDFIEISANKGVELKAQSPYGDRVTISIPVEPSSTLNEKDKSIVVNTDMIKRMLLNLEGQRTFRLNMDESLPAIELSYEEENMYIRSLFGRYIDEM